MTIAYNSHKPLTSLLLSTRKLPTRAITSCRGNRQMIINHRRRRSATNAGWPEHSEMQVYLINLGECVTLGGWGGDRPFRARLTGLPSVRLRLHTCRACLGPRPFTTMGLPSRLTDRRDGKEFSVSIAAQLSILDAPIQCQVTHALINNDTDGTKHLIQSDNHLEQHAHIII